VTVVGLIPFVVATGLVGLAAHFLVFQAPSSKESNSFELFLQRILSGVAVISFVLVIAVLTGLLCITFILTAAGVLLLSFVVNWRKKKTSVLLFPYFVFCLFTALASYAVATFTKPYQALISAHDASVYIGSAFQLADSGRLEYEDPLVLEMTVQERELFYSSEDRIHSRFRGGVRLWDKEKGIVTFGFLPLFSAWLAFGILCLGVNSFLFLLSFFTVLGGLALYQIGRKLSGPFFGISLALVLFFFFPQFYFSRLPLSEGFAQMLFLCGLCAFLEGSAKGHQLLAGVLWGSMFLCRIDLLFFSIIFIVLLFTLHPDYKAKWEEWRFFLLTISGFALATFYWQIATGTYLEIWGLSNQAIARTVWIPFVVFLRDFLKIHRVLGGFLYFLFSAGFLILLRFALVRRIRIDSKKWITVSGVAIVSLTLFSLIGGHLHYEKLLVHASWAFVYIPNWLVAVLLGGFGLLFLKKIRQQNSGIILTLMILLLLPAVFFIARPLIAPHQPLFVRRFVPVVFALFFILSLNSWFRLLQILLRPSLLPRLVFASFILLITGIFYTDTAYLIRNPLFVDVISQIRRLAERIPEDALVVIPRLDVGIHMGLPLQYMMKRDSVSIPEKPFKHHFYSFLRRQIKKNRPVFVLSTRKLPSSISSLQDFTLQPEFSETLLFYALPYSEVSEIPSFSRRGVLRYSCYRLSLTETVEEKNAPASNVTNLGPGQR